MSYFRLLGLDREPFSTSPDPAFFYQSERHRALLANLLIEFRLKRGLSVVLGDIGTGKTTLARKLIQMLRERDHFLFHIVLDPTYPSEDLFFSSLIRTLGIGVSVTAPSLVDYRELLEQYLFHKSIADGQTVILIIDEAHKLNHLSLEALRILLNYETNEAKLLQLVLFGQLELLPVLRGMPNLADRISLKGQLKPLDLKETHEMIQFRLREAGYRSSAALFLDEAVTLIHELGDGYPRRMAMLCHRALREVVMRRARCVDRAILDSLIQEDRAAGWEQVQPLQRQVCTA